MLSPRPFHNLARRVINLAELPAVSGERDYSAQSAHNLPPQLRALDVALTSGDRSLRVDYYCRCAHRRCLGSVWVLL